MFPQRILPRIRLIAYVTNIFLGWCVMLQFMLLQLRHRVEFQMAFGASVRAFHMQAYFVVPHSGSSWECLMANFASNQHRLRAVFFHHVRSLLGVVRELHRAIGAFLPFVIAFVHEFLVEQSLAFRVKDFGALAALEIALFMPVLVVLQRAFVDEGDIASGAVEVRVVHAHVFGHGFEMLECFRTFNAVELVADESEREYMVRDVCMQLLSVH